MEEGNPPLPEQALTLYGAVPAHIVSPRPTPLGTTHKLRTPLLISPHPTPETNESKRKHTTTRKQPAMTLQRLQVQGTGTSTYDKYQAISNATQDAHHQIAKNWEGAEVLGRTITSYSHAAGLHTATVSLHVVIRPGLTSQLPLARKSNSNDPRQPNKTPQRTVVVLSPTSSRNNATWISLPRRNSNMYPTSLGKKPEPDHRPWHR